MKYTLLKKHFLLFSLICFSAINAQNRYQLPKNTVFYMEVNGKQLNKKINWAKFNPVFQEVLKKENQPNIWNDYSKTGVKYDDIQYHYFTYSDSVKSYNAHFLLDDEKRFVSFINAAKKEGLETIKKGKYSYVSLNETTFIAWNNSRAVLKTINYSKPYKYDDIYSESVVDSAMTATDSVAVVPVLPHIENDETDYNDNMESKGEYVFDYKEEIKYLEEDLAYYKRTIKDSEAEIERITKEIQYLKKNHKYPEAKGGDKKAQKDEVAENEPLEESEYTENEKSSQDNESDESYKKRMDSLNVEEFKIVTKLAEISFDEYFNSDFSIEVPKDKTQFKDAKSDLFAFTNFGSIFNKALGYAYMGASPFEMAETYLGKLYDSDSSYNLYFDKDKVKLITNFKHKDPVMQKSISDFYNGSSNKKLANLISDKSIGYLALNINGYKSFDAIYNLIETMVANQKYQKEISLMVETMKIALDEKALAKIAPGNAIFILNDLVYKKVDYTDYEYDEAYNEKEVKKSREVATPNFTFAFVTENEGYWSRFFDMLSTNTETAKNFIKNGNSYEFKNTHNTEIEKLIFAINDGIVYVTTSQENIGAKTQSAVTKKWAKEVSRHSLSGWFNAKKLVVGLEKEFEDQKDKDVYHLLRNNVGELTYKTDASKESIQTEMNYHIDNSSENSLMYFFDLFDEIYKIIEPADKYKKL